MVGWCRRLYRVDDGVEVKFICMFFFRYFVEDKFVIIELKSMIYVVIIYGGFVFFLVLFLSYCIRVYYLEFFIGFFLVNVIFIFFFREKF